MKTLKFKKINISNNKKTQNCEHPEISDKKDYFVRYSGEWIFGKFHKQWYGWNFDWFGSIYAGLQLDSLDEVWEVIK